MPTSRGDENAFGLVSKAFNVDQARLIRSIRELRGSFIEEILVGGETFWVFDHPTILDAATEIFRRDATMTQIFLLGARFETIAANVVCEDAPRIPDAMVVPPHADDLLVRRLAAAPDDTTSNSLLFSFLASRASDRVFSKILASCEGVLNRFPGFFWRVNYNAKIITWARANRLGLIDHTPRDYIVETLERAIFFNNDLSFMGNDAILSLIPPTKLIQITLRMRRELLSELSDQVSATSNEPDLDIDPSENFQEFNSYLDSLREIFAEDEDALNTISEVEGEVASATEEINQIKAQRERALERQRHRDDDEEWDNRASGCSPPSYSDRLAFGEPSAGRPRSIFSDVDE